MSARDFTPNVDFPLAISYDPRDVAAAGYYSDLDQQHINAYSELIQNSLSGSAKYKLTKRPGVASVGNNYGSSSSNQNPYLVAIASNGTYLLFYYNATIGVGVLGAGIGTTLIAAPTANYVPAFVDTTLITGSYQVVFQSRGATGTSGGQPQRVFYGTTAVAAWTEINAVSANFNAIIHMGKMESMDGYAFVLGYDRRVYNSAINTLNTWNTGTDYLTKQIEQDEPVGLARFGRQLLVFGTETMEVMYNNGNPVGSPLTTAPQLARKIGLFSQNFGIPTGARHYYVTVGKFLYFMGIEGRVPGLFVYDGSSAQRVSPPNIDKFLSGYSVTHMCTFSMNNRVCVALVSTAPNESTLSTYLLFCPDTKEWFQHASTVFSPNLQGVHTGCIATSVPNNLFTFGTNVYQDNAVDYEWYTQFNLPGASSKRKQHRWLGLDADVARSAQSLTVSASDDDYQTFTTLGTIDMTQPRQLLTRLGGFDRRAIKLAYTGSLSVGINRFLSRIE